MKPVQTKTDREMEDRMLAVADDPERSTAIARARAFKSSWIELGEILSKVYERKSWRHWGYASFDDYVVRELHVTKATASKLLASFRFLRTSAPKVLERAKEPTATATDVPSMKVVDFVARAEKRGAADEGVLRELRHAAFEEGADAPMLTKRFKAAAFPQSTAEQRDRLRGLLTSAGKRLATLLADPASPLDDEVARQVEAAVGAMLRSLDDDRDDDEAGN